MAAKFSIDQLIYANECCFADDFVELFNKYAEGTADAGLGTYHLYDVEKRGGLLNWVLIYSRADLDSGLGKIIDGMLTELIGDYGNDTI